MRNEELRGEIIMKENHVVVKSKAFALRIIRLYRYLSDRKKEFVLSKQVLRSGTSIGANIRESQRGQSKADFYAKLYIALKEADETAYWLELLHESDFLTDKQFSNVYADCNELISILVAITATQKNPSPNSSSLIPHS